MSRLTALPTVTAGPLARRVRRWSVESQLGSRRNAMTASTVLAARRAERDDVEAFLHGLDAAPTEAARSTAVHA